MNFIFRIRDGRVSLTTGAGFAFALFVCISFFWVPVISFIVS